MKHIKWDEIPYERVNDSFLRKIAWDGKVMIGLTEVAQGYQSCRPILTTTSR